MNGGQGSTDKQEYHVTRHPGYPVGECLPTHLYDRLLIEGLEAAHH